MSSGRYRLLRLITADGNHPPYDEPAFALLDYDNKPVEWFTEEELVSILRRHHIDILRRRHIESLPIEPLND